MTRNLLIVLTMFLLSCASEVKELDTDLISSIGSKDRALQDSIIKEHLENGAWKKGMYSQDWQKEIDKGLAKDSTIAYLWQQKAMPLFKQGKYEIGMEFVDKAVEYDRNNWQNYRAFIKCIFAKTYREAVVDFEDCKKRFWNGYVMDHSYDFYIALSKIQLNQFAKAEKILENDIAQQISKNGEDWVHHLDLFYLGIAKYEESISTFDQALKAYSEFSDALYYKGICVRVLGQKEEGLRLMRLAQEYGKQGYSINEDNVIYERYPYQVRWHNWD